MQKTDTTQNQRIAIELAMDLLRHHPTVRIKEYTDVVKASRLNLGQTDDNLWHYLNIARLYLSFEKHIPLDDLNKLLDAGLKLQYCAADIKTIDTTHDAYQTIIKCCIDNIELSSKNLAKLIKSEIQKIQETFPESIVGKKRFDLHHSIRDIVALKYLCDDCGCRFAATEVEIKIDKTKTLKIDAVGWHPDGSIIGIEVKVSEADYHKTKKEGTLDLYSAYCNKYYVLTNNPNIRDMWEKYCSRGKGRTGCSTLYYDGEKILSGKDRGQQSISSSNRNEIIHHIRSKVLTKFQSIEYDERIITPDLLIKTIHESLANQYIT